MSTTKTITPADARHMFRPQLLAFGARSKNYAVAQAELARRAARKTMPDVADNPAVLERLAADAEAHANQPAPAKARKAGKPANPVKQAATKAATDTHGALSSLDADGKARWWATYKAHTAQHRADVAATLATAISEALDHVGA